MRDTDDEEARAAMVRFAEEAVKSADANHAARGKLLQSVLIPFADWLEAEVSRGMAKSQLMGTVITGFGSSVALALATLGEVKDEDIEELAESLARVFYAELAGALYQAAGKYSETNRSMN